MHFERRHRGLDVLHELGAAERRLHGERSRHELEERLEPQLRDPLVEGAHGRLAHRRLAVAKREHHLGEA